MAGCRKGLPSGRSREVEDAEEAGLDRDHGGGYRERLSQRFGRHSRRTVNRPADEAVHQVADASAFTAPATHAGAHLADRDHHRRTPPDHPAATFRGAPRPGPSADHRAGTPAHVQASGVNPSTTSPRAVSSPAREPGSGEKSRQTESRAFLSRMAR